MDKNVGVENFQPLHEISNPYMKFFISPQISN